MRCIRPLEAGKDRFGNIIFSQKHLKANSQGFQFPCGKCIPCRLNTAREKAIRAWHETQSSDGIFLTLTYNDENLKNPKLDYKDFQLFMKKLRKTTNERINFTVTGEYGDLKKRPHWHTLLFNYRPSDQKKLRETDLQHTVYTSDQLTKTWNKGNTEYGDITIESAGYVSRYAAKKLVHGKDQDHDFHPIHRTSCKNAIGKTWISKNYLHTFTNGFIYGPNGEKLKIPRYYKDWCKQHHPDLFRHYELQIQPKIILETNKIENERWQEYLLNIKHTKDYKNTLKPKNVSERILLQKFEQLQKNLKGDI